MTEISSHMTEISSHMTEISSHMTEFVSPGLRRRRPLSAVSVTRPQEAWVEGEGGEGVTRVPVEEGG